MTSDLHIAKLSERHKQLEAAIQEALQSPSIDNLKITELKREKLRIKEQIEGIGASQLEGKAREA